MKFDGIDIEQTIASVKTLLKEDKTLSSSVKATLEILLLLVTLLCNRLGLNSKNSSKPPSADPNREKEKRKKGERKPGGQQGRIGKTLEPFDNPDNTEVILLDQATLPAGQYTQAGFVKRQVVDIEFTRIVTEYQAQILLNERGKRFVAPFPEGVTQPVQYGDNIKAHTVYLSQYQLMPYDRIREYFADQLGLPLSEGSVYNFIKLAYDKLDSLGVDEKIRHALLKEPVLHSDETGININAERHWLHCASSQNWTWLYSHAKRGTETTNG